MTDQAMTPTAHCTRIVCAHEPLILNAYDFWVCPKCKTSYGADAKEGLPAPPPSMPFDRYFLAHAVQQGLYHAYVKDGKIIAMASSGVTVLTSPMECDALYTYDAYRHVWRREL